MSQPAYFILEIDIHDAEGMKLYLAKAGATLTPFEVTTLVNGGAIDTLEGEAPQGKVVMLRFESMAQAQAWYASPAYQEVLGFRLSAAKNRAYFVEGVTA